MNTEKHSLYPFEKISKEDTLKRSKGFKKEMKKRRSIRSFSSDPVEKEVIENIIMTASSAPSGANKQPWVFCAISEESIKSEIRKAAEKEEYEAYHGKMSETWLNDLKPFDTDWHKPFLEKAPWLIVVFKKPYGLAEDGSKEQHYYVNESVGIACGFLISAIQQAGLVTLTHTPSPMAFLSKILKRPENERPFLLLPVGYPEKEATVPNIQKKGEAEVIAWY